MFCHQPEPITFEAQNVGIGHIEQSRGALSDSA
jgi:hypothetical protein